MYEWRTGTAPSVVERPHLEEPPEQVEEDAVRQAEGEMLPSTLTQPSPPQPEFRVPEKERGICVRETIGERAQRALLHYLSGLPDVRVEMNTEELSRLVGFELGIPQFHELCEGGFSFGELGGHCV